MDTSVQAAKHFQWSFIVYDFPGGVPSDEDRETSFTSASLVSLDSILSSVVGDYLWGRR